MKNSESGEFQTSWVTSFLTTLYSLFNTVDSKIQKIPRILQLLRITEYMVIVYWCLSSIFLSEALNSTQIMMPILETINKNVMMNQPSEGFLLFFSIGFIMLFMTLLVLKYKFFKNNYEELISWILTAFCLGTRLVWFWIVNQAVLTVICTSNQYPIVGMARFALLIPLILYIIYMSIIFRKQYIYGLLHYVLPTIIIVIENIIILYVALSLMFAYANFIDKQYRYKILCNSIMVIVLWGFFRNFFNFIAFQQLILVGVCFLTGVIHYFYAGKSIELNQNHFNEINSFKMFLERKRDNVTIENQLFIQQFIIHLYTNISLFQVQEQQLLLKTIKNPDIGSINKNKFLQILQTYLQLKKQKISPLQILIYQTKINQNQQYYKMLLILYKEYHNESFFHFFEKYELAKILFNLQNWFNKFKSDNNDIFAVVSLESTILMFYNKMELCLKALLSTFQSMAHQVITFQRVWEGFSKSLKIKKQLQKTLTFIGNKFKRIQQFVKYNSIMQLFNLPKYNMFRFENLKIQIQPRASYLRVHNQRIMVASLEFKTIFKYYQNQLEHSKIDKISPFKAPFLTELSLIHNLKIKDQNYPIMDAYGYLHLVHLQIYIQPLVFNKIQYIVFLSPIYTTSEAYFLYDCKSDIVEQISKGFANKFKIDISEFHNFSHTPIFGKQIFQDLDFSSQNLINSLQKQQIRTKINTSSLGLDDQEFQNQNVFLTILQIFNVDGLKYLIRIRSENDNYQGSNDGTTHHLSKSNISIFTKEIQKDKSYFQIIEKKTSINQKPTNRRDVVTIIYMCIIIVSTIVSVIIFYYSFSWFSFLVQYIEWVNSRSVDLLDLFLQSFQIMHLTNFPPSQLQPSQAESIIQTSKNYLSKLLYTIQEGTIHSLITIQLPFVSTDISNYGYSLKSTNNDLDLFFNIVYSVPLLYTLPIVTTLIQNYKQALQFALSQQFLKPYQNLFSGFKLPAIIVISIGLALLPIAQIYKIFEVKTIESTILKTQQLFSFIDDQQITKKIQLIKKSLSKLKQPLEQQVFKLNQTVLPSRPILKDQNIHLQTKQIIKYKTIVGTIIIIILQVCIISFYFFLLMDNVITINKDYQTIVQYQTRLSLQQVKIKGVVLSSYFSVLNQKFNNQTDIEIIQITSILDVTVLQNLQLPSYFHTQASDKWKEANQNLCILSFQNSNKSHCEKIIDGIMTKGIVNTLQIFKNSIYNLYTRPLDLLYQDNLFNDILFLEEYILAFIRQTRFQFKSLEKEYIQNQKVIFLQMVMIGIAILVLCGILGYYHQNQCRQKKIICKAIFKIFPDQNFKKIQVKEFVENTNIIEKLSKI